MHLHFLVNRGFQLLYLKRFGLFIDSIDNEIGIGLSLFIY